MKSPLLAILAGILFALSLPPWNAEWLAWFAWAPVLVAAQGRRPLEAVGLGLIAGISAGFVHIRWHGDVTALLYGYMPYLWITALVAAQALASSIIRPSWQGLRWIIFLACLGVSLEWLTIFSPLPISIAISQYRAIGLIQIAGVAGIWGISFLLWLANATIADSLLSRRPRLALLALPVGLVLLSIGYSRAVLSAEAREPTLRVAAIQDHEPNETTLFVPAPARAAVPDRDELTRQAAARGARLAVWSEDCLGSSFIPASRINPSADLARSLGIYLVVGYSQDARPKPYNTAAIVDPAGAVLGVYHKIQLFGGERQTAQPGTIAAARAFPTPLGKIGMEICFDTCYPDITRRLASEGAQLIAVPNSDPLTYDLDLHRLHAALLSLRAAENDVAIVRSDPNGHSRVIAPDGAVLADAPAFTAGVAAASVPLGSGQGTFYTRWGNWLAYLCLAWVIVSLAAARRVRRRTRALPGNARGSGKRSGNSPRVGAQSKLRASQKTGARP